MSKKDKESKKYKYLITMRWYVETDEKLLNLVQHRTDGKPVCKSCPTRNYEGYGILDYHHFMGDNKEVYMSSDKIVE